MADKVEVAIDAKKLDVGSNATMSREEAVKAAEMAAKKAAALYPGSNAKKSAEISLFTEGAEHDRVQKVRFKLVLDGHVVVQTAHSRSIRRAIERAAGDMEHQVRKLKERKTDGRVRNRRAFKRAENRQSADTEINAADILG